MARSLQPPFDLERVFNVGYFGDPWHGLIRYYWLDDAIFSGSPFVRPDAGLELPNGEFFHNVPLPYGTDVFWYKADPPLPPEPEPGEEPEEPALELPDVITTLIPEQQAYWEEKGMQWLRGGYIYGNGRYGAHNLNKGDQGLAADNLPYTLQAPAANSTDIRTSSWVYFDDLGRGWEVFTFSHTITGGAGTSSVQFVFDPMPRGEGGPGDYTPIGLPLDPNEPVGRERHIETIDIPGGLLPSGLNSTLKLMDAARSGKKALYMVGLSRTRGGSFNSKFANASPPRIDGVLEIQVTGIPGEGGFEITSEILFPFDQCWGQLDEDTIISQQVTRAYRTPIWTSGNTTPFGANGLGPWNDPAEAGASIFAAALCSVPPDAGEVADSRYEFVPFIAGDNGWDTYLVIDSAFLGTRLAPFIGDISFPISCPSQLTTFAVTFQGTYATFRDNIRLVDVLDAAFENYLIWVCYDNEDEVCEFRCDLLIDHNAFDAVPVGYETGEADCPMPSASRTEHSFTRTGAYANDEITYRIKSRVKDAPAFTVLSQDTIKTECTATGFQEWEEDVLGTMFNSTGNATRTKKLTVNGTVVFDVSQTASTKGVGSVSSPWSHSCPFGSSVGSRLGDWNNFIAGWAWRWIKDQNPVRNLIEAARAAVAHNNSSPATHKYRDLLIAHTETVSTVLGAGASPQVGRGKRFQEDIDDHRPIPSFKPMVYSNKLVGGFLYPRRVWGAVFIDAFYQHLLQPNDLVGIYPWTTTGLFAPNYTDSDVRQDFTLTQAVSASSKATFEYGSDIWSTYDPRTGDVVRNYFIPVCYK